MAVFHEELLENEATIASDSKTHIEELPKDGFLSAIALKLRATNGATSNKGSPIWEVVSKVEVRDGAKILFSISGQELVRMNWMKFKKFPAGLNSEDPDDVQYTELIVPFGRFVGDQLFALDLGKLKNPDYRITYNLAAVNAVGATGFVTGTFSVTSKLHRAPPGVALSPRGWIKWEEEKTFTSLASGEEQTDLQADGKLIGVGIYAREAAIADDVDITFSEIKIMDNNVIISEGNWDDIQAENCMMMNIDPTVRGLIFKSDTDTFDTYVGTVRYVSIKAIEDVNVAGDTFNVWNVDTIAGDRCTINASLATIVAGSEALTANTTDAAVQFEAIGVGVSNWIFHAIAKQEDLSDALDMTRFRTVRNNLTNGAAGATVGVVTEKVMPL